MKDEKENRWFNPVDVVWRQTFTFKSWEHMKEFEELRKEYEEEWGMNVAKKEKKD